MLSVFTFFLSAGLCLGHSPCGKNAHDTQCGTACPRTCEEPNPKPCGRQCVPGCFCDEGFLRNSNGQCVLESECNGGSAIGPCGKNAHHTQCGTACPKTCDNPNPRPCGKQCIPGCFCDDGFVRNSKGQCVRESECPGASAPDPCGENAHHTQCGTACPKTCDNPNPQPCGRQCVPGCFCNDGYVQNAEGKCVRPSQCPASDKPGQGGGGGKECGRNEHFTQCGTMCPKTCESIGQPQSACPAGCFVGCVCDRGYVRKGKKKCVKPRNC